MKSAIQAVLSSTTDQLLDLEYVESLVKGFGLFNDPRDEIYGSPYNTWIQPTGGMYQIPRQIAQFVIYLHDKEIKSYLEIGAFYGYTFAFVTAYLSKFGLELAHALDSNKYIDTDTWNIITDTIPIKKVKYAYQDGPIERMGHESITESLSLVKYDLVFIDGNHAYSAVKADWENVGRYAKICAFHDINDMYIENKCEGGGPVRFWRELRDYEIGKKFIETHKSWLYTEYENRVGTYSCGNQVINEFTYHSENKRVMGIGVIQPGENK